uniref:Metalloendopeptidase n=1 Tax=Sinocyclocheilus rhinocerous TaxID=307959 RepID=A0A673L337_9TELE
IMYLLVVVISLLLSSVPAQSRPVEVRTDKIETENYIIINSCFLLGAAFHFYQDRLNDFVHYTVYHTGQRVDGPLITFGDIAVSTGFKNADPCTARECKWERSTDGLVYVPYVISNQYSPDELKVIERGLRSFADVSCIRFVPHEGQRHFLHIMSDSGCYSYLGRQGGGQVVSLERPGCVYHHTVQHELLHALGFHHEQNRSDRDKHIKILLENSNFKKSETNNLATPYDYNSLSENVILFVFILFYLFITFSRNNEPTMIPIPDGNVVIGEARSMSRNDILRINRLYCSMLRRYC